jgi:hypothetical protein
MSQHLTYLVMSLPSKLLSHHLSLDGATLFPLSACLRPHGTEWELLAQNMKAPFSNAHSLAPLLLRVPPLVKGSPLNSCLASCTTHSLSNLNAPVSHGRIIPITIQTQCTLTVLKATLYWGRAW